MSFVFEAKPPSCKSPSTTKSTGEVERTRCWTQDGRTGTRFASQNIEDIFQSPGSQTESPIFLFLHIKTAQVSKTALRSVVYTQLIKLTILGILTCLHRLEQTDDASHIHTHVKSYALAAHWQPTLITTLPLCVVQLVAISADREKGRCTVQGNITVG